MKSECKIQEKNSDKIGQSQNNAKDLYHSKLRFIFIIFCALAGIGISFCYDCPVPLYKKLILPVTENGMGLSIFQYNLLYSLLCLPNCILPLFGGIIMDKYTGKRKGLIILGGIILIGQLLSSFSTILVKKNESLGHILILSGRFIFGIGCESFLVNNNALVNLWFHDQEISFALSTLLSSTRLAFILNDNLQPFFYRISGNWFTLGYFFAFGMCVFSFIFMLFMINLDQKAEMAKYNIPSERKLLKFKMSDLRIYPPIFWLICVNCGLSYMTLFSFNFIASGYYQDRFGVTQQIAGLLISIPSMMSLFLNPLVGILSDCLKNKVCFVMIANFVIMFAHIIMSCLQQVGKGETPNYYVIFPIIFIGLGLSFFTSTIWSLMGQYIDKSFSSIGYGLGICIQNMGIGSGPFLFSYVKQNIHINKNEYINVNFLIIVISILAFGSCFLPYFLQKSKKFQSIHNQLLKEKDETINVSSNNIEMNNYK